MEFLVCHYCGDIGCWWKICGLGEGEENILEGRRWYLLPGTIQQEQPFYPKNLIFSQSALLSSLVFSSFLFVKLNYYFMMSYEVTRLTDLSLGSGQQEIDNR